MLDARSDGACQARAWLLRPKLRIELIELPHLAIGSPAKIAAPGILQIRTSDLFEAARRVEPRGQFIGERLVVDEAVVAGRADSLLVQALGV